MGGLGFAKLQDATSHHFPYVSCASCTSHWLTPALVVASPWSCPGAIWQVCRFTRGPRHPFVASKGQALGVGLFAGVVHKNSPVHLPRAPHGIWRWRVYPASQVAWAFLLPSSMLEDGNSSDPKKGGIPKDLSRAKSRFQSRKIATSERSLAAVRHRSCHPGYLSGSHHRSKLKGDGGHWIYSTFMGSMLYIYIYVYMCVCVRIKIY